MRFKFQIHPGSALLAIAFLILASRVLGPTWKRSPDFYRPVASWKATATGGACEGLEILSGEKGQVENRFHKGSFCVATVTSLREPASVPNSHGPVVSSAESIDSINMDNQPDRYIYCRVTEHGHQISERAKRDIYLIVEYYDAVPGTMLELEYASTSQRHEDSYGKGSAEERAGGIGMGTRRWQKAFFLMHAPCFQHHHNMGADFRIKARYLCIRSLALTFQEPPDWARVGQGRVED